MRLPSKIECLQLICRMDMMDHIVAHSLRVCQVALTLSDCLMQENISLNRELIRAGALLHDITKTRSFSTRENHAETGGVLLGELGYPDVANIVRQHVKLDDYPQEMHLGEAQIVNYADKRVLHDQVVSLDRRMRYIVERYCRGEADRRRISWLWEKTRQMETQIFTCLPFGALELSRFISADDYRLDLQSFRTVCPGGETRP